MSTPLLFRDVPISKVCAYWSARPCNIRHSLLPIGTREYFEEVEDRKNLVEPHIPAFVDFPRWKDRKVLEIGCGIGTDTIRLARDGAQVSAVDLTERSVEIARRRAAVFGLEDRIRFYVANAEELSSVVPLEPYDLVYSFGSLHHTPHPERVLEQVRQYLRPGGILKVMVYHRHSWKVLEILLRWGKGRFWKTDELIARYSEAQTGCPVTYAYSRREGRLLLEQHGFEVTGIQTNHVFPYRVRDYKEHRYVKTWLFRWMPRPLFWALERCLGWHLCLTAQATPDAR